MEEMSVWELLNGAGYAVWGLLICSIIALTVTIERTVVLWKFSDKATTLAKRATDLLGKGAIEESRAACERGTTPLGDVFLAGFARRHSTKKDDNLASAIERDRLRLVTALRTRVWTLGTIGALAPFIGLYGTVLGIRSAFREFEAKGGEGGISTVSGDIGEALIVTAIGIVVALIGVVLYNYFNQRLGRIATELKLLCQEFSEHLVEATKEDQAKGDSGGD